MFNSRDRGCNSLHPSKWLIFTFVLAILFRLWVYWITDFATLGADVGRMAIISHAWKLKGGVTTDLRPYDMANGFFYFPATLYLLYFFDLLGINPITAVAIFTFIFSIAGIYVFYKIARIFMDEDRAIASTFFYSLTFDFIWIYSFFGMFTFGWALLFFMISLYSALRLEEKLCWKWFLVNLLSTTACWLFHWFAIVGLCIAYFSIFLKQFITDLKTNWKYFLVLLSSLLMGFGISIPAYLPFIKYIGITRVYENQFDLLTFAMDRLLITPLQKFQIIFFTSYVGTILSSILVVGFVLTLALAYKWILTKNAFPIYFFLLLGFFSYVFLGELNMLRLNSLMWITYAMAYGYFFNKHKLNLILIPILFLIPSPSFPYLINALYNQADIFVPFADFHKFNKAMAWINENTPINSTFLIDGGGSGCTGASASFGERIFPLTSRRIFYFTDYCWAIYDRDEFMRRVELYRKVSIDPSCCIDELKEYGIDYIFIGERWVGLNPRKFEEAGYELVYNESGYRIFKVN